MHRVCGSVCPFGLLRFVVFLFNCFVSESSQTVESLLSQGTISLGNGKLKQALDLYSEAVEADPNNYMARYRRATAYIAMGKLRSALPDIDKTVSLNPGYVLAYKQRAKINLKLGNLKEAQADLLILKSTDDDTQRLLNDISDMETNVNHAKLLYSKGRYSEALPLLDYVMKTITSNSELHEMRALCNIKTGDHIKGIEELRESVHMVSDNREGMLRVSVLMYDAGLATRSLEEIRNCLRLDPDDKGCRAHYAKVRVLAKAIEDAQNNAQSEKWSKCLPQARRILELEGGNPEYVLQSKVLICRCGARSDPENSLEACDYVISRMSKSVDPHLDKAEAYINLNKYDEAEAEYKEALKLEQDNQQALKGLKNVKNLKSSSSKRDYYKILGVKRTASDKEISQAYRELAGKNHPDRFPDEEQKKAAEKRFLDINDAREVLLDKKMRALFDSGVDPKDPEAQAGGSFQTGEGFGHGHQFFTSSGPFGFNFHNFDPFGAGGGHFEFHFG
ncbi:unnamed protein product [Taenia asiatica]|uniref:J domain-containing protein n=1 Tax=Taenia asiatica TaxID=60517 RepID=A0A0R3WCQ1_TAEAS|nr:unnamed protein product [Taenia asiatica]